MLSSKDFNFAYGFRPIYYFSRVFGLMPFTLTYNSNGKIDGQKIKVIDILWFVISITMNLVMIFMISGSTQYLHHVKSTSLILEGGDHLLLLLSAIFDVILMGFDMCIRFKLMEILKNIDNFDDEVRVVLHVLQTNSFHVQTIFRLQKSECISTTWKTIVKHGSAVSY